jgi:undecaprenyl-diphosphatase
MLIASAYDLSQNGTLFSNGEWFALLTGFVVSFLVALISIKWLLNYVKHHTFTVFGVYRIIIALLFVAIIF